MAKRTTKKRTTKKRTTKKRRPSKDWKQAIADRFAAAITDVIEGRRECLPWRKPWKTSSAGGCWGLGDHNPTSGTVYTGINIITLCMARADNEWTSLEWGTFRQWTKHGGCVRQGEKSTPVVFWKPTIKQVKDEQGNPVLKKDGTPKTRASFFLKGHAMFNRDQVEGLPARPVVVLTEEEEEERELLQQASAEAVIEGSGADIHWDTPGRAFYAPKKDEIHMPPRSDFREAQGLYGVAMHELVHWTGHSSRIAEVHPRQEAEKARPGIASWESGSARWGDETYAAEELVAELGAAMLCAATGVTQPTEVRDNHVAYLVSWSKKIKDDPMAIFSASSRASDATTYLLSRAGIERPTIEPTHPHEEETKKAA